MSRPFCFAIVLLLTLTLRAAAEEKASWEKHNFDLESGILWQRGSNTPIPYRLVITQFSWRSPYHLKHEFANESKVLLRSQVSLIGTWVERGPEDYYFGFSGAPSLEWWSPSDIWSIYTSIGGGVGVTNSTDVPGGQGQDLTLNWFSKFGVRYQWKDDFSIHGGLFFQHLSNGGKTDPNPGIDALGFTLGASWTF